MYRGWLNFGGNEIANNERVRTLTRTAPVPVGWFVDPREPTVQTALSPTESYDYDNIVNAPWYDPTQPASQNFFGVFVMGISGLPDGTRQAMDPFAFAMYRSLFAAVVMLPLLPIGRGRLPKPGPMLASVALSAAVYALLILSMTVSTSGVGILLQYTGPIFCALFALETATPIWSRCICQTGSERSVNVHGISV